jgi:hypothetical protein
MRWNRTSHRNATVERDKPCPSNHIPAVYRRYPACSLETHHTGGEEVVNGKIAHACGKARVAATVVDSQANALLPVPGSRPIAGRSDMPVDTFIRW